MTEEKLSSAIVKCPNCQTIEVHVHGWKKLQIVCAKCGRILEHAKTVEAKKTEVP